MPTLSAEALYRGPIAHRVMLDNNALVLDMRQADTLVEGVVITDPISPDEQNVIATEGVNRWQIITQADVPEGSDLQLFVSTGSLWFSDVDWTEWARVESLDHTIENPVGLYLKLKYVFTSQSHETSPVLRGVVIHCDASPSTFQKSIHIADSHNEALITSAFDFGYERADCSPIQSLVETHRLRELIGDKKTDLDRFVALMHWVAQQPNTRQDMWADAYPWTLDELVVGQDSQMAIKGHCMSYASVLVSVLTGLGYYARHWAIQGFRFMDHEVVEVWSDELKKWIYLDPSLDQYYADPNTDEPLSLLEMHRIFVDTFFEEGETLHMSMDQQRQRVKEIGGKNAPIRCVDYGYHYGSLVTDYDWGWLHGYLAAGFMRLTTRNNFHSQPEPAFDYFGEGNDDDYGFPQWVDEKTPPKTDRIEVFSGRERDFYWSLNQVAYKAVWMSENTLEVEFGHTQPFFSHYIITVNQVQQMVEENTYKWVLKQRDNTLTVAPVNEWGSVGITSHLSVNLS